MAEVLAVILNWRRPEGCEAVVKALRGQSIPLHIAIVECATDMKCRLPYRVLDKADTVFTVSRNLGPASRFIAPLALPEFPWTLFAVDDHLPGRRHVEHLLCCAESLHPDCATIGSDGRIIRGGEILRRNASSLRRRAPHIPRDKPLPVDFITSSELCRTRLVQHALRFRDTLIDDHGDKISLFEDDLILCFGAQLAVRARTSPDATCFIAPESDDPETCWKVKKLPAPHALSARPDHDARRTEFIRLASETGFVPLAERMIAEAAEPLEK